jgi:hypothetical protein
VFLPFWLPIKVLFEKEYVEFELSRYENQKPAVLHTSSLFRWLRVGLSFYYIYVRIPDCDDIHGGGRALLNSAVAFAFIWAGGGILYGLIMWLAIGGEKNQRFELTRYITLCDAS